MRIKVCGMRNEDNIIGLCQLPIDFIGFIFYPKSARYVNRVPRAVIPSSIKKVGVFVNATMAEIAQKSSEFKLDYIQLHGDESEAFCQELKEKEYKLIKAFSVDDEFDFSITERYESSCDFFLLDTKGKSYGGNGIPFNWGILKKYQSDKKFFLSGGIDLNNIERIKKLNIPLLYAIDVNSKFETEPALKDLSKIKQLTDEFFHEK
ncbi:phosphoribosylanthranilate isomerase [Aureispira]|nr:phosphoribosylanthranilate isomerase [Aureispira sp.]